MIDASVSAGVDVMVEREDWRRIDPEALAQRCYDAAGARATALRDAPLTVMFADDAALRALNARFRNKDAATNVLSFPGASSPVEAFSHLGDIAVSYERCAAEAGAAGVAIADHAAHLLIHGMLHLIGYDHQTDDEAAAMEALEADILADLGIADPYAGSAGEDHE